MKKLKDKRTDFESNHYIISESFHRLLIKNKRIPTLRSIASDCGMHLNTVHTHVKLLSLEDLKPKFKIMTKRILTRLGVNAMNYGKAPEVKLFMQLIENYAEKTNHELKVNSISELFMHDESS